MIVAESFCLTLPDLLEIAKTNDPLRESEEYEGRVSVEGRRSAQFQDSIISKVWRRSLLRSREMK